MKMILIGYSGHALVAAGILKLMGKTVTDYCDVEEKRNNPLNINYLGKESEPGIQSLIPSGQFFISVGDNKIRKKIAESFLKIGKHPITIIHPSAIIDSTAHISDKGTMISAAACINSYARIDDGVIINTMALIEHECKVESYAHIGPGAILCGNVSVGTGSFVGAGAVLRQNIKVGNNVMIGAGAVVVKDIADHECVVGNPAKKLNVYKGY